MLEPTTEYFHQEVCVKFNTNLKQLRKDVEVLKEWIRQQPHLPQCSSDSLLTNFLIGSKNRMERAKEKIDNYYTVRSDIPEFYGNRDPEQERIRLVSEEITLLTLPKMTPDGCRVTICSFLTGDITKYDITAYIVRLLAHGDVKLQQDAFLTGDYLVLDATHYTLSHVMKLTPTIARNLMRCLQDVMPVIMKKIIIIKAPTYMELVINLLKPFAKGKLIEKFQIHSGGPEVLEKYFPRDLLPSDYGGKEDSIDTLNKAWYGVLQKYRGWLLKEGSATVDENKRPRHTKSRGLQELQGSFKTLCVD